jgi:hypothetical protein
MLSIEREYAVHLMSAPNLEHFDMDLYGNDLNEVLDGISAPSLKSFASHGWPMYPHTYDIRAPQLQTLTHHPHSCLPKSAPNITKLITSCEDLSIYAHLTNLTDLSMCNSYKPIMDLPPKLKILKISTVYGSHMVEIQCLPPFLEELHISESCAAVFVDCKCESPKTLKLIKLAKRVALHGAARGFTGTIVEC